MDINRPPNLAPGENVPLLAAPRSGPDTEISSIQSKKLSYFINRMIKL